MGTNNPLARPQNWVKMALKQRKKTQKAIIQIQKCLERKRKISRKPTPVECRI